jgi:hypothetical protein
MASTPVRTSSVVQGDNNTKNPDYVLGDTPTGGLRPSKVQPWPYLLPCPESPEDTDPLCLHQACQGVLTHFYCDIKVFAEHYAVPEEELIAMVTDWVVSKKMGVDPLPATFFIPEKKNE